MTLPASISLDRDWFEQPLAPPVTASFTHHKQGLLLVAKRAAPSLSHPSAQPHQFFEGLWEGDVAEAFLLEPDSGRYLEVNLAPNGAWWACWHSGVRQREETQPSFSDLETRGATDGSGWEASLWLPLSLFTRPETLRYNLTFILNSPDQTFHTVAPLSGAQPDFHQPEHFLPLRSEVPS